MNVTDPRRQAAGGSATVLEAKRSLRTRAKTTLSQRESAPRHARPIGAGSVVRCDAEQTPGSLEACGERRDGIAELHDSLDALKDLYGRHAGMEAVLRTASRLVVQIVDLDHCSVGSFDESESGFCVRASHTREGVEVDPERAVRALSDFARRERPKQGEYAKPWGGTGPHGQSDQTYELTAPLRIDRQIVGYLYGLRSRFSDPQLLGGARSLFITLSQHVSAAIEAQQVREMLDCPCIATLLDAKERRCFSSVGAANSAFPDSAKNPEAFVRRIGRGFFDDLHRAGFEAREIVSVATEIIDGLNGMLRKMHAGRRGC